MTSPQTHRILRLVVEVAGCRRDAAAALQAAAAQICQRDWLPVIDRVCSTQADARRVLRIDRLQVDLGVLPAAAWRAAAAPGSAGGSDARASLAGRALVERFEAAFADRLAEALRDAAEVQTDAELLAFFLQTGALPWWADVADRHCIVRAAQALWRQPAAAWRQWLAQGGMAASGEPSLRRLAAALPPALRLQLLASWLAEPAGAAASAADARWTPDQQPAWQSAMVRAAVALGRPPSAWERAWWQAALATALWPGGDGNGWPALLHRWLVGLDLPAAPVRRALRAALDAPAPEAGAASAARLGPLWRALRPDLDPPAAVELDDRLRPVLAVLGPLGSTGAGDAALWRHLLERLVGAAQPSIGPLPMAHLPLDLRRRLADAWERVRTATGGPAGAVGDATRSELTNALQALLQAAVREGLVDPGAFGLASRPGRLAQCAADWAAALHPAGGAVPGPPVAAGIESLYVPNSGLVLLWPFVQRFAERLELLEPAKPVRWRDGAAAQRAAVLLHCVISGDAEPPEFQLLLPKLLCGLPLDEPLVLDEAPSADEQAECEAMLVAAIAQAPILRQMSVAGFRASFGLREGQLSCRDGHWLLRVERQAYDVVIDRFPWSASLVRLPWMPSLLQVQW